MDKDNNQPKNEDVVAEDDSLLVEDQPTNPSYNEALADSARTNRSEDEVLQSAAHNLSEEEAASRPQPVQKKSKKSLIVTLVLLLLVGVAAGAWYYYNSQQSQPVTDTAEQSVKPAEAGPTYEANTVVYANRDLDTTPYTLYARPAAGGDRSQALKLNRNESINHSDIVGNTIAFSTPDSIFISTDAGETYDEIMELGPGEQITSVKLSSDGQKIAFGLLPANSKKNSIRSMDITGENSEDIFTANVAGINIKSWDKDRVIYEGGCYNCDDVGKPYIFDRDNEEITEITFSDQTEGIVEITVSQDASKVIILNAAKRSEVSGVLLPPYQIEVMDVVSGEKNELTSIGEADEKNENGTEKSYTVLTGFLAGENTPYYTEDNMLYVASDNEPSLAYESNNTILGVSYISTDLIIASVGSANNFSLINYNYATGNQETTTLLSGDTNTSILGVTTN